MIDPKDIHIILIGSQRVLDYRMNLEILRYNFSNANKYWITTVYNGDQNALPSGIGENTFILLEEDRGYCYGALDAFNKGLNFAACSNRPYVVIFNFDVWFYKEENFLLLVDDFVKSNKSFAAGFLPDHYLPMTDCMLFRRDYLKQILPIADQIYFGREKDENLKKMYEGTQLGFNNMEEFVLNSLMVNCHKEEDCFNELENIWFKFQRDGAPRYRFTEKYTLSHMHSFDDKKQLLLKYNVKNGNVINDFLSHENKFNDSEGLV